MTLEPGTRLGTYEIVALIGAGGMGEVYRARDGKLTRHVALKVLPELFARDPERLARFTREANLLATLNHPNIAAIYGFESSVHIPALVLEMVEGPTLADRIQHGPIALEEAQPIARQIAEALEAAHAQNIVHRDLKPANIKIRDDGTVKVRDFGLAKALAADNSAAVTAGTPTITSPAATMMGAIMGTAAYMSPEQARGRAVDKRSDIWSYGAVLYEMLTGKRAFDGDDVSDTLANILKRDPDWSALSPAAPPAIVRVVRRCLVKDPRLRMHDMADVRIELEDRTADPAPATASLRPTSLKGRERAAWMAVALVLGGITGVTFYRGRTFEPSSPAVLRFQIQPPDKHSFGSLTGAGSGFAGAGALSPDGTRVVFNATDQAGHSTLWLHALDSFEARKLPGTNEGFQPFWSPDGQFVAFFAGRKLYRIDAARGEPREICAVHGTPRGGSWGTSGTIVFATSNPASVMRVPAQGGRAVPIERGHADNTGSILWPSFLPDGDRFLYVLATSTEAGIHVGSIDSGLSGTRLVPSETQAVYVEPGYLLSGRDSQLVRQVFDPRSRQLSGEAVPVVDRLRGAVALGFGEFSASSAGVLAYRSGTDATNQFAWVDRTGTVQETVGPTGRYRAPALSPDGRRLAFTDNADGNLKLLDLQRQNITVLTSERGLENCPVWSPDGARLYYRVDRGGIFVKDVSGPSPATRVLEGTFNGPSQALDGTTLGSVLLFFATLPNRSSQDIVILPLTGEAKPATIVESAAHEVEPQVSPDGKWLAYVTNETGRNEVYVEPFPPDGKRRWPMSTEGGRQPIWRADGRELFFVSDDRRFFAVTIENPQSFDAVVPKFLFNLRATVHNTRNSYVPSRDGQRFLVNLLLDTPDAPINVIYNRAGDLK